MELVEPGCDEGAAVSKPLPVAREVPRSQALETARLPVNPAGQTGQPVVRNQVPPKITSEILAVLKEMSNA